MKPRLIITIVNNKMLLVADGDIDVYVETDHDTRKIELETITREDFDSLLKGKMQDVIL